MLLNLLNYSDLNSFFILLIGYLDPGSGSLILQVIIASLVGIGYALRKYWNQIRNFFNKDQTENIEKEID
jgi:hypothetical protein